MCVFVRVCVCVSSCKRERECVCVYDCVSESGPVRELFSLSARLLYVREREREGERECVCACV